MEWTSTIEPSIKDEVQKLEIGIRKNKAKIDKILSDSGPVRKEVVASKIKRPDVYEKMAKVTTMEKTLAYLRVCHHVQSTAEKLATIFKSSSFLIYKMLVDPMFLYFIAVKKLCISFLEQDGESDAVSLFHQLHSMYCDYVSKSSCTYFKDYMKNVLDYWELKLLARLTT